MIRQTWEKGLNSGKKSRSKAKNFNGFEMQSGDYNGPSPCLYLVRPVLPDLLVALKSCSDAMGQDRLIPATSLGERKSQSTKLLGVRWS